MSQSGSFGQGGSGGGGVPINPLRIISDFDDFLSDQTQTDNPRLGWTEVSGQWSQFPGTATNPGITYNFGTGGTTSSDGILLGNTSPAANAFLLSGSEISINWVAQLGTLSTGVNRYITYIGMSDSDRQDLIISGVAQPQNGCFFKYSDNINSGKWQLVCGKAGVYTTVNTTVAADTNFHNFGIIVNSNATSVTFTIDGVTVGTAISTNIPNTVPIGPAILIQQVLGNIPFLYVDLFYYLQTLNSARPGTQGVWPGSGGNGNVIGPAISTDKAVARFNGTTGKLIENSLAILSDAGALSGLTGLSVTGPSTFNGAQIVKRTPTAIDYNVLITDYYIGVTSTAAPRSIVLPVTGATSGQIFTVKDESGGAGTKNITVTVEGGALIDGAASQVINGNYQDDSFIFNGTNYFTY